MNAHRFVTTAATVALIDCMSSGLVAFPVAGLEGFISGYAVLSCYHP